ncbi:MAG TPA: UDP-N-acetylmuramate:L-alanyl-gamma-D-glutamyl-meso-diaminopimelate ligase [Methylococcaceae bacterium]|nr:UDP-N-acetylmuramate:L-alanyl-gamma-D-glutamyl-meso-diaminopimelate ligase [Methylococcaceae bacterium]
MHIHILGVCGTFMGGLAVLARQLGHQVSGSDQNVYPPMSTQLEQQGIRLLHGYRPENLDPAPDLVVIGNALSRGNPEVEAVLNRGLPYLSGPEWLREYVLQDRHVIGIAGTHGKTTTTSMTAWLLEAAGLVPGFLVGGVPLNFGVSARLGGGRHFVVEADEYDTAFFDKRSKFVHYRPRTAILNNLEYDHADIFPDLAAIQKQFHHLVRTVPGNGLIVHPTDDTALKETLAQGCWTAQETTAIGAEADWRADLLRADGGRFRVRYRGEEIGEVNWELTGKHNVANALSALAAARHAGVDPVRAVTALRTFRNVRRRMEVFAEVNGITLYDDFAHHPTAIRTTLDGLRARVGSARIVAVLEPRSNTMRLGVHADQLAGALEAADESLIYQPPNLGWDVRDHLGNAASIRVMEDIGEIVAELGRVARPGDHLVFMSNGGFGGIHALAAEALRNM